MGEQLPTAPPEADPESDGMTDELRAMLDEAEGPAPPPVRASDEISFDEPEAAPRASCAEGRVREKRKRETSHFELSSNAIDLGSILRRFR